MERFIMHTRCTLRASASTAALRQQNDITAVAAMRIELGFFKRARVAVDTT
jgi:hypothetical protein